MYVVPLALAWLGLRDSSGPFVRKTKEHHSTSKRAQVADGNRPSAEWGTWKRRKEAEPNIKALSFGIDRAGRHLNKIDLHLEAVCEESQVRVFSRV